MFVTTVDDLNMEVYQTIEMCNEVWKRLILNISHVHNAL